MARFQIVFAVISLVTIANGGSIQSWNSLLRADLFPVHSGTEILGSGVTTSTILTQLKTVLGNPTVLSQVYRKYLVDYNKGNRKSEAVFVENVLSIVEHNMAYEAGLKSWEKGVNQFTDMNNEELQAYSGGLYVPASNVTLDPQVDATLRQLKAPAYVNYYDQGIVTPIKNQGSCGSCWAFASIASLESKLKARNGQETILSEQEMLDCDRKENGCQGGWIEKAFDYLKQNGVVTSNDYPYSGTQGNCQRNGRRAAGWIGSFSNVMGEDRIRDAVAQYGVLSVGVVISNDWYQYKGGIYEGSCGQGGHFLAVIGYGTYNGKDYWIIKNSWGTQWGSNGYMYLVKGRDMCGIGSRNGGWFITG